MSGIPRQFQIRTLHISADSPRCVAAINTVTQYMPQIRKIRESPRRELLALADTRVGHRERRGLFSALKDIDAEDGPMSSSIFSQRLLSFVPDSNAPSICVSSSHTNVFRPYRLYCPIRQDSVVRASVSRRDGVPSSR